MSKVASTFSAAIVALLFSFSATVESTEPGFFSTSESIPLPNAYRPEGIVRGFGPYAYVGSIATGSIYQLDLETGEGSLLVDSDSGRAFGLAYDRRTNYLFAAGGNTGLVNVFDAADGQLKASFRFFESGGFINDGIVLEDAAYFTNTFGKEIFRIPLAKTGRLPEQEDVETIPLGEGFEVIDGSPTSNGIESTPDGKHLIIVNPTIGKLFKVDPNTGEAEEIYISNGELIDGDGLVRVGNRLYVVQNRLNQVAEILLNRRFSRGHITRVITDPLFRIPSTATTFRNKLFIVNARFGVVVDENTDYDVVVKPIRHFRK